MAETRTELTSAEMEIFDAEWDPFLTRHFRSRDVIDIFEDHNAEIKDAAAIAKYELEASFGGSYAKTNEFGWMMPMPNFFKATTTPTYDTGTWREHITTANVSSRWVDWLGTSTTAKQISKYACFILLGFMNPIAEPKTAGVLANIKSVKYPIWYFEDAMVDSDYQVYELPTPVVIEPEQEYYFQKYVIQAGWDYLHPIGIYFATGDHMRDKSAYAKV